MAGAFAIRQSKTILARSWEASERLVSAISDTRYVEPFLIAEARYLYPLLSTDGKISDLFEDKVRWSDFPVLPSAEHVRASQHNMRKLADHWGATELRPQERIFKLEFYVTDCNPAEKTKSDRD